MARRYATGRYTYAPSMYNDAIKIAMKYGVKPMEDTIEELPTIWAEAGRCLNGNQHNAGICNSNRPNAGTDE